MKIIKASHLQRVIAAATIVTVFGVSACTFGASSSGASGSSAVQKALSSLLVRPTTFLIGKKITSPIPKNKSIITIDCGQPACIDLDKFESQAAKVLGWKSTELQTDNSATQIDAAWQTALDKKPGAIIEAGVSRSEIAPYIQQAKAKGIQVILTDTPDVAGNGVLQIFENSTEAAVQGTEMGTWVAAQAVLHGGGSSAATLFVNLADFPILATEWTGYKNALAQYCPACTSTDLNIGLTSLGDASTQIETYLRANPSVKYVAFSASNIFDAVPPALQSAGIKVSIIGAAPDGTALDQLRTGVVQAQAAWPGYEQAYAVIDTLARFWAGVAKTEPAAPFRIPQWILTKSTVPAGAVFPIISNELAQYKKAWGK